ncbi:MAG: AtpZ/AtpI family protein [Acidimicrobiales bacterium]|nr:AtpZ/AtpI family protein [Acidimicrobiales bacterium]
MDSSQRREMVSGMHRSTGSFELVLTPVLFAFFGLWLDRTVGTVPLFTVAFAVFAIMGVGVKLYYAYDREMAEHEAERAAQHLRGRTPVSTGSTIGSSRLVPVTEVAGDG